MCIASSEKSQIIVLSCLMLVGMRFQFLTESLSSLRCQLVKYKEQCMGLSGSGWIDSEIFKSCSPAIF